VHKEAERQLTFGASSGILNKLFGTAAPRGERIRKEAFEPKEKA